MALPRLNLRLSRAALRRPAVLAPMTMLALAALLGAGLLVAGATGAGPLAQVDATASPQPSGDPTTTSGGDDNVAVANNTRDGSTVYAIRLKVVILNADPDVVDSGNAAVAAASCSDCQTVAIALEGVVVTGDAEVVAPVNISLAINSGCSGCQTLAYAYQNLQTVDGKVYMSGEGRRKVAELRRQLHALRSSGLDILAVKAEVDRITSEFAEVLNTTIVPIGQPAGAGPTAAPSASAAASPGSAPAPSADDSPAPAAASPAPSSEAPAPASPAPSAEASAGEGTAQSAAPESSPTG